MGALRTSTSPATPEVTLRIGKGNLSHASDTLGGMNITTLLTEAALDTALRNLAEAGLEFEVVCSGPERTCPDWRTAQAA
jgi:hypothetical protein